MSDGSKTKISRILTMIFLLAWNVVSSVELLGQEKGVCKLGRRIRITSAFGSHHSWTVKRYQTIFTGIEEDNIVIVEKGSSTLLKIQQQSSRLLNVTFAEALRASSPELVEQTWSPNPVLAYGSFDEGKQKSQRSQRSVAVLIPVALLSAGIGYLGGGLLGFEIETSSGCDTQEEDSYCGLAGFVFGATGGAAFTIPLGVHLGNGRQGNFPLNFLVTLIAGGAGLLISIGNPDNLITVPLFQITAAIATERITSPND